MKLFIFMSKECVWCSISFCTKFKKSTRIETGSDAGFLQWGETATKWSDFTHCTKILLPSKDDEHLKISFQSEVPSAEPCVIIAAGSFADIPLSSLDIDQKNKK